MNSQPMKFLSGATLALLIQAAMPTQALAQSASTSPKSAAPTQGAPAAKAAKDPASPVAAPGAAKGAGQGAAPGKGAGKGKAAGKGKVAPPPPPEPVLPEADADQIAAAARVYVGEHACEFKQVLNVTPNAKFPHYFDVQFSKEVYVMKPVASVTGAIRLEGVKGKTLLIQIANKSMLMDVQAGKRLVDDCLNQNHRDFIERMSKEPKPEGDGALIR